MKDLKLTMRPITAHELGAEADKHRKLILDDCRDAEGKDDPGRALLIAGFTYYACALKIAEEKGVTVKELLEEHVPYILGIGDKHIAAFFRGKTS